MTRETPCFHLSMYLTQMKKWSGGGCPHLTNLIFIDLTAVNSWRYWDQYLEEWLRLQSRRVSTYAQRPRHWQTRWLSWRSNCTEYCEARRQLPSPPSTLRGHWFWHLHSTALYKQGYLLVSEVTLLERLDQKKFSLQMKHGEVKVMFLASQIKKHYKRTFLYYIYMRTF